MVGPQPAVLLVGSVGVVEMHICWIIASHLALAMPLTDLLWCSLVHGCSCVYEPWLGESSQCDRAHLQRLFFALFCRQALL